MIPYAADGPAAAVSRPPTTGPTIQLAFSTVCRSAFACGQLLLAHEVRHAGVDRRPEEAGREAGDEREPDDGGGIRRERQRDEHADAQSVGRDHQRAALEPVEQRPEQEPDDDRRQELDDEHRTDPEPGVRPVLDVDRERDRRQQRPGTRAERREEEVPESRQAERCELCGGDPQGGSPEATT